MPRPAGLSYVPHPLQTVDPSFRRAGNVARNEYPLLTGTRYLLLICPHDGSHPSALVPIMYETNISRCPTFSGLIWCEQPENRRVGGWGSTLFATKFQYGGTDTVGRLQRPSKRAQRDGKAPARHDAQPATIGNSDPDRFSTGNSFPTF